jgi:Alcohol dehydrogenase GroES-like domain
MRAFQDVEFAAPIVCRDLPDPRPQAGEVIVEVASCGLCHTDVHLHQGHIGPGGDQKLPVTALGFATPAMLGHESFGRIAAFGSSSGLTAADVGRPGPGRSPDTCSARTRERSTASWGRCRSAAARALCAPTPVQARQHRSESGRGCIDEDTQALGRRGTRHGNRGTDCWICRRNEWAAEDIYRGTGSVPSRVPHRPDCQSNRVGFS